MNHKHEKHKSTSWEPVGNWYQTIVGEEGHYYHQHVILPQLLNSSISKPIQLEPSRFGLRPRCAWTANPT